MAYNSVYQRENMIPSKEKTCPKCGSLWPDALNKPYRLLTCQVCKDEKRRRYDLTAMARIRRREARQREADALFGALSPEERKAVADKAYEELFGPIGKEGNHELQS